MTRVLIASIVFAIAAGNVWAKLPVAPMTEEQKAKAEEAKAKAAEGAKKEAELLAKYQDKAAANYKKSHASAKSASPAQAKPGK